MGQTTQDALVRLKQEFNNNLQSSKKEQEEKVRSSKNEIEEIIRHFRTSNNDEFLQMKEDLGLKLQESETRTHRELSKLLDDTTQAIEDSINGNLVAQMKELD